MNVSVVALSFLLVMGISSWALLASMSSDPPTSCCYRYVKKQLPRKFVTDYYKTSSLCFQPAVVFLTRRGRQVCANPSDAWVQSYVEDLQLN